jgi:hypothetical protein
MTRSFVPDGTLGKTIQIVDPTLKCRAIFGRRPLRGVLTNGRFGKDVGDIRQSSFLIRVRPPSISFVTLGDHCVTFSLRHFSK